MVMMRMQGSKGGDKGTRPGRVSKGEGQRRAKPQRGGAPLVGNSALGSVRRQELELGRPTGDGVTRRTKPRAPCRGTAACLLGCLAIAEAATAHGRCVLHLALTQKCWHLPLWQRQQYRPGPPERAGQQTGEEDRANMMAGRVENCALALLQPARPAIHRSQWEF